MGPPRTRTLPSGVISGPEYACAARGTRVAHASTMSPRLGHCLVLLALASSVACGGSTASGARPSSSSDPPPEVPDGYQPDEHLPLDQGDNATSIAIDAPCGAAGFTPRLVLGSLSNRVEVDFTFEPADGSGPVAATIQLQLDTTVASCTLGNEGNVGSAGGAMADAVDVRGIFLVRTSNGVHDLRIPTTLSCENLAPRAAAPSVHCSVFGHAPAADEHGTFVTPPTATSDAFYSLNGGVTASLTLTWESGRQDVDDAQLAGNVVNLGTFRR
jgi:hypothetical protein